MVAFTDNFNRADENLEASANWTRVGGAAGDATVSTNKCAFVSTTTTAYQSPDKSSADHYTQVVRDSANDDRNFFETCIRLTDGSNYFGARHSGGNWQVFKCDTGSFTQLGSNYTAGTVDTDVMYLEGNGNGITFKLNGTERCTSGTTDAFNNTETRQGFVVRVHPSNPALDDYEADALAAAGGRIMGSLAGQGGLAGMGGIAGPHGGLAG